MNQRRMMGGMVAWAMGAMMMFTIASGGQARGQVNCNPDTGPGENLTPMPAVAGYSTIGKQCTNTGWLFGTKCFPMGAAVCGAPTTITNGQTISMEANATVGGVGVKVGTSFTAQQQFGPVGGAGMKCRFWVCYANSGIFHYNCTRTILFSWDNSYTSFHPGLDTVTACCQPCTLESGDGPPDDNGGGPDGGGGPPLPLSGRRSINIDLTTHFTPFSPPPPGHPIAGPHSFFGALTQWHLCQIQTATDLAGWEGSPGFTPMQEIVVFDVDGTPHHFLLDADPFPFWPGLTPQLTQNSSIAVTPGVGIACFDDVTMHTLATSTARSYDLATNPGIAGHPYTINGVVSGIDSNSGAAISATVSLYSDSDGGAPGSPGTDLVLLASSPLLIPHTTTPLTLTASFAAPVTVAPGTVIVAELTVPDSPDGAVYPGANSAPQTGPTYFLSTGCAIPTYVDRTTLGFPNSHFVQVIVGTPVISPCPANIVNTGTSVNKVDVDDLLAVISNWGPCPAPPAPCPANIVNTGTSVNKVDVDDLLAVISAWGPCP